MKIITYDVSDYEVSVINNLSTIYNIEIKQIPQPLTSDNINLAVGYDGVSVLGYSKINSNLLARLKEMNINHISTRTIGFDHIDVTAAKELGITVSNANYSPNNVADFTVMMMLMLLRKAKISICRSLVNDFSLNDMMGRELRSMTIGIVGTGKIGSCVIRNLSGFGCKILCCDQYKNPAIADKAEYVDLDTLYRNSDIISLHVPLTESSYHLVNKESISKMKDGIIIINTARGGLIDTEDLIEALESGNIGGAGIDTIEEEAGIMHVHVGANIMDRRSVFYLKQFPNVVYTQHYAFFTQEATTSMVECGINSLVSELQNKENPCRIK